MKLEQLHVYCFTYEYWRAGSLVDLGLRNRFYSIAENKHVIQRYAVGYMDAEKLWFRPKQNCKAVMFWKDDYFWTHLTDREFEVCFKQKEF